MHNRSTAKHEIPSSTSLYLSLSRPLSPPLSQMHVLFQCDLIMQQMELLYDKQKQMIHKYCIVCSDSI